MVRIDMTKSDGRELTPGIDLWEVVKATETKSKSETPMVKIEFARTRKPSDRVFDNVMLEGPGWPLGKQKLAAFIDGKFNGDLDLVDLIGKRVWLSTGIETYNGKDSLKVLIGDLKNAGMQPEQDVPPGCALPSKGDSPF